MGTATGTDTHPSEAQDINEWSELVGSSRFSNGQDRAAYKIPDSPKNVGWVDLGVLGSGGTAGNQSKATGINNLGIIVGTSKMNVSGSQVDRAFVISNVGDPGSTAMQSLSSLTDVPVGGGGSWGAADSNGWVFLNAFKINDSNWIIGYGKKSNVYKYFLLYPYNP